MKAKIIDFLEELCQNDGEIKIQNVLGNWCEIDLKEDLEIVKKMSD